MKKSFKKKTAFKKAAAAALVILLSVMSLPSYAQSTQQSTGGRGQKDTTSHTPKDTVKSDTTRHHPKQTISSEVITNEYMVVALNDVSLSINRTRRTYYIVG